MLQGRTTAILVLIVSFLVIGSIFTFILIEANSTQTGSNDHEDSSNDGFSFISFFLIFVLPGSLASIIAANEASKKKETQSNRHSRQAASQPKPDYYTSTPQTGLKFCTNCAASVAPDSRYCEYCGARIE